MFPGTERTKQNFLDGVNFKAEICVLGTLYIVYDLTIFEYCSEQISELGGELNCIISYTGSRTQLMIFQKSV